MDRQIIYPGQIPLETDLLNTSRNILIALGKLAAVTVGTATVANGLAVTQTAVPSMAVTVAAGEIYALANLDGTAYSSLALDTTHQIVKQGIALDSQNLSIAAPTTPGQSVVYLIQATYQDVDATGVVLPYYNSSNPSVAYSGPSGSGTSQYTQRQGKVILSAKAGTPATTGSQVAPSADSGYIGLYTVTVAYGASTVVNANIALASGAPFVSSLASHLAAANPHPQYPLTTAFNWASFVPSLQFGGASVGMTYFTQSGQWIQIGKLVQVSFQIALTALGSSTGTAKVLLTGLPSASQLSVCPLSIDVCTFTNHPSGLLNGNLVEIRNYNGSGSDAALATQANFTNTSVIYGGFHYFTA